MPERAPTTIRANTWIEFMDACRARRLAPADVEWVRSEQPAERSRTAPEAATCDLCGGALPGQPSSLPGPPTCRCTHPPTTKANKLGRRWLLARWLNVHSQTLDRCPCRRPHVGISLKEDS